MFLKAAGSAIIAALLFVAYLAWRVLCKEQGNDKVICLSRQGQTGVSAVLRREHIYLLGLVAVIFLVFAALGRAKPEFNLNLSTGVAFVFGAVASMAACFLGTHVVAWSSAHTANAAATNGGKSALENAVSSGAIAGIGGAALMLLGLLVSFKLLNGVSSAVNGYAMGVSVVALCLHSGAPLVRGAGPSLSGINPCEATLMTYRTGGNVIGPAGIGFDLFESHVASIIASLAVATVVSNQLGESITLGSEYVRSFPFWVVVVGLFSSIAGVVCIKMFAGNNPRRAFVMGAGLSVLLCVFGVSVYACLRGAGFVLDGVAYGAMDPAWACIIGLAAGLAAAISSGLFTTGAWNTIFPVGVMAAALFLSYEFGGVYGVCVAALGMLSVTGMAVTMAACGLILRNAASMAEIAGLDGSVWDIKGDRTDAIVRGYADGAGVLTAVGLLCAFMLSARVIGASLADPQVLACVLAGAMAPRLFLSMMLCAASRCAAAADQEAVHRFGDVPGACEGREDTHPDGPRCVALTAGLAVKGMLIPVGLAIVLPVIIGFSMGAANLAGMLIGAIVSGAMLGARATYTDCAVFTASINVLVKLMCVIALVLAPVFAALAR